MGVVMEGDALRLHLLDAAVDDVLLHLEVGNAVAEQAAGLGVLLVEMHVVAGAGELLRAGHAGRPGADHGDALAGLHRGQLGRDPAFLKAAIGDRRLDRLDRHRLLDQVQRARRLAGRRADAAGDLGKIVGGVQVLQRALPVAAVDEVVPVGDLVIDRAAGVAERDAAIHAARGLLLRAFLAERDHELAEMAHAIARRLIAPVAAVDLQEACYLTHARRLSWSRSTKARCRARPASIIVRLPTRSSPIVNSISAAIAAAIPSDRCDRMQRR